jgi:DNA-binding response OmpR family regulator
MIPSRWGDVQNCSGENASILIVDDNIEYRSILRTAIEQEGFSCEEAEDGLAALKVFQSMSIDFIITDFQMPNMNGCEFLESLSREASSVPPTVMITGGLSDAVRTRALDAGAMAVLTKPVRQKEVLRMVREAVSRKPRAFH